MTRHLADHRTPSQGGRFARFLAIERANGNGLWLRLGRRPQANGSKRGLIEFLRIARGRQA